MEDKLLQEIEEVQARIEQLSTRKSYSLLNAYLQTGLFFFLIFLLSITQSGLFFQTIAVLSFIISAAGLLKTVADITYFKKDSLFSWTLAAVMILFVGLAYYALWTFVLAKHSLLLMVMLGIVIFLASGFYLIHGYLSYLRNTARRECTITALLVAASWLLWGVSVLYKNPLTYLLLIILVLILLKAVYDFSQRFVRQEN
ncbi:MAG: hypothetical protein KC535_03620 [Nanoarchaeota archaeon]|nr:hypothetical protein [Nanoarchaeota archaeon]